MTPAHGAVVVHRLGLWRVLLVVVLVVALAYRYFIAPVLDGIDRVTPWDGAVPGSCGTPTEIRPAGLPGMAHDAGRLLDGLADGPPAPAQMVGWFRAAGEQARTVQVAFRAGTEGQALLPTAPEAPAPGAVQVRAPVLESRGTVAAQAAAAAGWTGDDLVRAVAVALAESSGDPRAINPQTVHGSRAHGLWQTMIPMHSARFAGADPLDPHANARVAYELWQESGWRPWLASAAAHAAHMAEARAAVQGVTVQPVTCAPPPDSRVLQASLSTGEHDLAESVIPARRAVLTAFGPMTVGGWGTRGNPTEHDDLDEHGRRASNALDFMTTDLAKGDAITAYLLANAATLNTKYVIWNRHLYRPGQPPRAYHGASPHTDHVHFSAHPAAGRAA